LCGSALAVSRVFVPTTAGQRNLWRHALQVAVAARTITSLMTTPSVLPAQAYLAGLLHDIGRFVMFEAATEDLGRVDEAPWHSPQQLMEVEHALLGYDHVQLGVLVCRRWSLPQVITEVIKLHHDYAASVAQASGPLGSLIAIVQLADLLSMCLMDSPGLADQEPVDIAAVLAAKCMRPEWPHPPVSASVLAQRVGTIRDEAAEIAERLLDARTA
jgi:putative nucleotidyltransferase with HDIG domain